MGQQFLNHLFSFRKRSALSQTDVAFLLGIHGGSKICKHERFSQEPGLRAALAYEAIYGRPVSELFSGLFEKIEGDVKAKAKIMEFMTFSRDSVTIANRKRKTLAAITGAPGNKS